jgi:LEA14-like dessication related protein
MRKITLFLLLSLALLNQSFLCRKPRDMEFKEMQHFKMGKMGFDKTDISMDLIYFNPNNFQLKLKDTDCDVFIDGNYLGHFRLDSTITVAKKANFTFPVNMQVDMKNVFKNGFNTLFSKEVLLKVNGSTRAGKGGIFIKVPIRYEGKHSFGLF